MDALAHLWRRPERRNMLLAGLLSFSFYFAFGQFTLAPLFLKDLGQQPGEIGVMLSSLYLSSMIARPFIGRIATTVGVRRLSILSCLLWIATVPAFLFLTPASIWLVYPLRMLQGVSCAGVDIVVTVIPQQCSAANRQARGYGLVSLFYVLGWSLAPYVAEWLLPHGGFHTVFLVDLAFGVLALLVSLAFVRPSEPEECLPVAPLRGRDVLRRTMTPGVWLTLLAGCCGLGLAVAGFNSFLPLYAQSRGLGAGSVFFLFNSVTNMMARGLFSGLSDRLGRRRVLVPAFLLSMVVPWIVFDLRSLPVLILAGLIYGVQNGMLLPALVAQLGDVLNKDSDRGLAVGLFFTAMDAGAWLGSMAFGFISEAAGYGLTYVGFSVFSLLAALATLRVRPAGASRNHSVAVS